MSERQAGRSTLRSRVVTRTARPDDLAAVLTLVRQHHADATYECALTGLGPGTAAAAGFGRLLADPGHRVVLAVLPGPTAHGGHSTGEPAVGDVVAGEVPAGELAVGLAVFSVDALSVVLGSPQVAVDWFVIHRDHRRTGAGAALLAAAAEQAERAGADHVVVSVGGHETERQRFFARMGFAPLSTRRIAGREMLSRQLTAWQRGWRAVPSPRRPVPRRRPARQGTGMPPELLSELTASEG